MSDHCVSDLVVPPSKTLLALILYNINLSRTKDKTSLSTLDAD